MRGTTPCLILFAGAASLALGCGNRGDGADGDGESTESGGEETTVGEKFDVLGGGDGGTGGDCNGGMGGSEYDFSIIWISNTTEGTVSKIDTITATELARYRTGPDDPDPSRTSVNLLGDVAIANRAGSVTKIAAEEARCEDRNDDDVIQTSSAPFDILPWFEDECVLWNHDVMFPQGLDANTGGPRAVAWDGGNLDANPCEANPNVWVGWRAQPDTVAKVRRLDGLTGAQLGEAEIPDWECNWDHGTYGGAADRDGAFWGLGTLGTVLRVDPETYDVQRWENPEDHVMYGITLDPSGRVWLAGYDGNVWRFDPGTEQFTDFGPPAGPSRLRGLMVDRDGNAWIAGNEPCALSRFDTVTEQHLDGMIDLPGCSEPVGVSIDFEGYVWVVDRGADQAYKVDPDDYSSVTVGGLVDPYTYSDMTGVGLDGIINPPQG
jgi:streptogramin lyase